jgi:uncharacterized protein YbjT (DUF2867 family)
MYVIIGATGNVGGKVAENLLASGQKVRAIARNAEKLKQFSAKGGEALPGSVEDAAFLTRVFEDAKVVFTMIPTDIGAQNIAAHADSIGEAISSALASARVPYVVNLSSLGAEHKSGTGPIAGLHRQEERLNQLGDARVLHLRPTYFMENFFAGIPMIKNMGIYGTTVRPHVPLPMIATQDIAQAAADSLLKLDFPERKVRLLLGPRNYTFEESTKILGRAIGRPDLPYVHFSQEDGLRGMIAAGISPDVAAAYIEMESAIDRGFIANYPRDAETNTPTTMEQFASAFAAAYNAS